MRYLKFTIVIFAIAVSAAAIGPSPGPNAVVGFIDYIKSQTDTFALTVQVLSQNISEINSSNPHTVQSVISALKTCRLQYKRISFFLDYFYPQQGRLFNSPAKKEVEEPFMEYEEPQSLQQIEAILFGSNPEGKKTELGDLVLVLNESANGLKSLYYDFDGSDPQIFESIHLELIRVMALYIAGYDAPYVKTGILESHNALLSMCHVIDMFLPQNNIETLVLDSLFYEAVRYTRSADFDHFNRLFFLTRCALPLEEQLGHCIKIHGWQISTVPALNYNAKNLFQGELTVMSSKPEEKWVRLGHKLFFETALSGNFSRSCASCHQPDKYFTDQLTSNRKFNSQTLLRRNTPTLLYSACQSAQFWDGRAPTLGEQIGAVLTSPDEMNGSIPEIEQRLNRMPGYRAFFHDSITLTQIEDALKAYLETLQPQNSAFDRFISGDKQALSFKEQNGFNLFMGKAQCGTCHFVPVFNGSTPPLFNRIEYEVLGVPATNTRQTKTMDEDLGRYELYPAQLYKRAFKTPTIRNVAFTNPYMHNGYFPTLRSVIDFYNKGGGVGMGLGNAGQTLSEKPLHLSQQEIADLVAFLYALSDNLEPLHTGRPRSGGDYGQVGKTAVN